MIEPGDHSSTEQGPVTLEEPELPPLLNGRRVIKGLSVLDQAIAGAASAELGAGDVLWSDDPDRVEFAIVLEPDVALAKAAQVLPMTMCSLGDCIGVMAPPQVGVMFRWPDTILVNGGNAGSVKVVAAPCGPQDVPEWLAVAVCLRFRHAPDAAEPGHLEGGITALAEEGCEELTSVAMLESCARHFLTWLDLWQDDGFRPVHNGWLDRAEGRDQPVSIPCATSKDGKSQPVLATVLGLDEDGNLLIRDEDGAARSCSLADQIAQAKA